MVDRVDGQLCLDLEPFGEHGKRFDEGLAHGAVAGHDIVKAVAVDPLDHAAYEVVAKAMKGSLMLLGICTVLESIAFVRICFAGKDGLAQGAY